MICTKLSCGYFAQKVNGSNKQDQSECILFPGHVTELFCLVGCLLCGCITDMMRSPELIAAVLVNGHVSTGCTTARLSRVAAPWQPQEKHVYP